MSFREVARDDFAVRGIGNGLAYAKKEAHREKQSEAMDKGGSKGRHRPKQKAGGEHPVDVQAVDEPAGDDLEERIRPEKRGEE